MPSKFFRPLSSASCSVESLDKFCRQRSSSCHSDSGSSAYSSASSLSVSSFPNNYAPDSFASPAPFYAPEVELRSSRSSSSASICTSTHKQYSDTDYGVFSISDALASSTQSIPFQYSDTDFGVFCASEAEQVMKHRSVHPSTTPQARSLRPVHMRHLPPKSAPSATTGFTAFRCIVTALLGQIGEDEMFELFLNTQLASRF